MDNLLVRLLKKLGVEDYSDLTDIEKATYKQWEEILAKDVKIEDVSKFLDTQIKRLNRELREAVKEGDDRLALNISAKIDNFETIVLFIREPLEAKKRLEESLLETLN